MHSMSAWERSTAARHGTCRAFFPLTSGLDSYPLPLLSGNATGASLTTGGPFGHAVNCQQSLQSVVMLDVVPYAAQGAFSVNLWFRPGNVSGSVLQYLFSQAIPQDVISPDGTGPNQVQQPLSHRSPTT